MMMAGISESNRDILNDSEFEELDIPDEEGDGHHHGDSMKNRWKKIVKEGLVIPYRQVHEPPQNFKSGSRKCFIPGRPIYAKIIDVEHFSMSNYLLNPNLYVIQLKHGSDTWIVKRRYKHFQHLHQQLQLFRVTMAVPMPTKTHRERRSNYKSSISHMPKDEITGKAQGLPRFPKKPEALVSGDQLEERKQILEQYLQSILKIRSFRNHHQTLEFLDVSHLSFVHGLGPKGREGLLKKRTGTTHTRRCTFGICACFNNSCLRIQRTCGNCCTQWQRRWLITKETYIAYIRPKDGRLHCVMLIDNEFEVSAASYSTGYTNSIIISNLSRELILKCWTKRKAKEWLSSLRALCDSEHAKAFIKPNRFSSYAPIRTEIDATWFVDGSSYMSAVADALEEATEEILISDWWLSPEIYMKRPILEGEKWRLDKILQRKASQGVKVFVLLYKEVNLALGINSFYSKQRLVEQHPNIKVLRHPDHISAGVFLWAHHEKLVVVDQLYAFVGGIDLCYGRWDDNLHRLTDLGSVDRSNVLGGGGGYHKKMTSSKPLGSDIPSSLLQLAKASNLILSGPALSVPDLQMTQAQIEKVEDSVISPPPPPPSSSSSSSIGEEGENEEEGAGPPQPNDIPSTKERVKGETPPLGRRRLLTRMTKVKKELKEVTRDLKEDGRDWVNRHLRKKDSRDTDSSEDENEKAIKTEKAVVKANLESGLTNELGGLQGCSKLWIGKDYTNFIVRDFSDLESPFTDLVDRSTTPRMPWHDIGILVQGKGARDIARHFIQRWNASKDEKVPLNHHYPYLLPKSYSLINENFHHPLTLSRISKSRVSCQVLRSLCHWSGGARNMNDPEESIHEAYRESIEKSKHYIYIENQFFISLATPNANVQNKVGEALFKRIVRAHKEKSVFRVFVIIPLLPGFEGEVGTSRGVAINAITHWNYSSICRGSDALLVKLKQEGIEDTSQYVTFHGLRTHSELLGDLVTELIYVHSKLMIIDDNLVICGSANINDRSLTGKRDSEVCVIIQDESFNESKMNGEEYKAGKFAQSLRKNLFREHLGLKESDNISDPISDDFYQNVWLKTAETNTSIYERVFQCVPSDKCLSFAQLAEYQKQHPLAVTDTTAAKTLLDDNIRGHLVYLPLDFLKNENLLPSTGTKEALMPTQLWT